MIRKILDRPEEVVKEKKKEEGRRVMKETLEKKSQEPSLKKGR